ncbi:MAG: hypothetical protein CL498_03295 [Actinobacteria bacterium]|nr:hypothetical protein [Actinomycetota bacterium]|tara:strand:+ start:87 stop:503 length:417 start_codon:yes stop_codon:yes gene_type:complete
MSKFNSNNKFDVKKWLDFMNTAISNIDETLSTQILDNSLAYKNNISHNTYIFDNGWIPRVSLDSVKYIENPKVLIKFEPKKIFKEDVANFINNPRAKQQKFVLKKLTKFLVYYPKTNQVREIDMSEYADLGLKKYIIK